MFTLLHNTLNSIDMMPGGTSGKTISDFSDKMEIAPWAKDAMTTLVEAGIINGCEGKLSPADTTTRAEMVQVLYKLLAN